MKSNLVRINFKDSLVPKNIYKKLSEREQRSIKRFKEHQRYIQRMQKRAGVYRRWDKFFNSYYITKSINTNEAETFSDINKKRIDRVTGYASGYSNIYYSRITLLKQIYLN